MYLEIMLCWKFFWKVKRKVSNTVLKGLCDLERKAIGIFIEPIVFFVIEKSRKSDFEQNSVAECILLEILLC